MTIAKILSDDLAGSGMGYLIGLSLRMTLIAIEGVWSKKIHYSNFNLRELKITFQLYVAGRIVRIFYGAIVTVLFIWTYEHHLLNLPQSSIILAPLVFLLTDFCYYWTHRYTHQIKLGWADHLPHHSAKHMNMTAGVRLGVAHLFSFSWSFYWVVILLGVPPGMLFVVHSFLMVHQFWIHTEMIPKLGWAEYVLNTPSHHRVHHGKNPEYIDKNFGGFFIVWDRLFGTFKEEDSKVKVDYGVGEPIEDEGFLAIAFLGWRNLWSELQSRKTLSVLFEKTSSRRAGFD